MGITQIVIMVVAVIGMFLGLSKQKAGAAWGKPLAVVSIIVAIVTALWSMSGGGSSNEQVVDREIAFQKIGGKKLGLYLAEKHSGGKVLILTEPKLGAQAGKPNPLIEGLKEGLGTALTVVGEVSPEVPADKAKAFAAEMPMEGAPDGAMPGEMMPPLEYWFSAKIFDDLVGKQSGFDVLVTTIGLPQDARNSKILRDKDRPKIAVLNGSIYDLKAAIRPDMIVGAITYNPKAEYDDKPVPKDLDEAFNKRFLLVTPDNLGQVVSTNPDIFRAGN
ncbi:MAG: hypothetical protein GX595_06940 [Lentisphaerae bacterium]|nr:hypothetical protein [Lentisphaerota bacterium]